MTTEQQSRFLSARRIIIENEFLHLNAMQRRACLTTQGPLLLLAGAGSGKTTVLIHRVANILQYGMGSDSDFIPENFGEDEVLLLEEAAAGKIPLTDRIRNLCAVEPAEPWQVIAITFTNKAANELKARLEKRLGSRAGEVWAMTFHGACARMLRRDAEKLGFTRNFTIYDQADSLSVMKRILKEMNLDEKVFPPKTVLARCADYKSRLLKVEEFLNIEKTSGDIRRFRIAEVCAEYARRLKDAGAMDFEDLMYYCVLLLKEYQDILERYQRQFRYVLIDEYQDTNYLQYQFAALLAGKHHNICVVGDDDQSIYKFRGATIENILNFEHQFKDARVIRLEQNYRSTGNILAAANAVIANNTERKGKTLWTDKGNGDRITFYTAMNEEDEAAYIGRTICDSHRNLNDFAVLYRTNAQSRLIEQSLRHYGISYKIYGGTRFFDRAEIKDMLAYLCVVANPTDETRLTRIINVPPRGIGQTSLERAREAATKNGVPLYEVLSHATEYEGIAAAKKMVQFCALIDDLQKDVGEMSLDEFYDDLIEKTGYVKALEDKHDDESISRIENVYELKSSIVKSMESNDGGDLYGFLDEIALYTDLDNYNQDEATVSLMTMHSAKGLEFPAVFIAGAEEGIFPGALCVEPEELEEERRLCYVAITRAMQKLYITCAQQRMLYGRTEFKLPSRFIEEIPDELLDRQGRRPKKQEYRICSNGYDIFPDDDYDRTPRGFAYGASDGPRRLITPRTVGKSSVPVVPKKPAHLISSQKPEMKFSEGDKIIHKAFGKGIIAKLQPMGNDALLTIDFEEAGSKKLMMRVASQHMKKEENDL